jgi:hypothetical protein
MQHAPLVNRLAVATASLLVILPAALAQAADADPSAASTAAPPALTLTAARDEWQFRLTGDLFSFDADLDRTLDNWTDESDRSGELYGATLGIKWPGMSAGSWLELSYRSGSMDGDIDYPFAPFQTVYDSDLTQMGLAIKGETGSRTNARGVPNRRWVWSVGYAYTHWDSLETTPGGAQFAEDTTTFHLLEITGGYSWAPLAVRTGAQSFFRLGPRLEGVLGIGMSVLEGDWFDDSLQIAFDFGGRGLLFADWTIHNITIGLEGGYQYIQYFSTIASDYYSENDKYSEALSGLIGRAECSIRF